MTGEKLNLRIVENSPAFVYVCEHAIDGSTSSFWYTNSNPAYVIFDVGENVRLTGFRFYAGTTYPPNSFVISVSDDSKAFSDVYSADCVSVNDWTDYDIETDLAARYVKVTFAGSKNSYVRELELYGTPDGYATNGEAIFTVESVQYITSALSSSIKWAGTTPEGTSVKVLARLAGGDFTECINGESIPGIVEGMNLSNSALEIKVELSTENPAVTPTLTGLRVTIQNEGDDHIVLLDIGTGNTTNIQNSVGEVNVDYAGGTLVGGGGMVPNFSVSFLPEGLAYKGHQHDVEHIDVSASATFVPMRIYYKEPQSPEHIDAVISATITLIHVDDL